MQQPINPSRTDPRSPAPGMPAIPASWGQALDLSSLVKPATPPAASAAAGSSGPAGEPDPHGSDSPHVINVTDQSFQTDVISRSHQVPVVLDFWADWCGPCTQLSPVLESLAAAADGAWVLAKIDIEANPGLAGAFRIQSIPMVMAIVAAQPVDAFSGVLPESQLRTWLAAVLDAAARLGVTGSGTATDGAAETTDATRVVDDQMGQAATLANSGDLDGAQRIFEDVLAQAPADPAATAGVAQLRLMRRLGEIDAEQVLADAGAPQTGSATVSGSAPPSSTMLDAEQVALQCRAADVEFAHEQFDVAFARLVNAVKRASGVPSDGEPKGRTPKDRTPKDRTPKDIAREHLLELLSILPADEPSVRTARRELSNALF